MRVMVKEEGRGIHPNEVVLSIPRRTEWKGWLYTDDQSMTARWKSVIQFRKREITT